MPERIGIGYDIHRLVPGDGVPLGGVVLPADVKPVGHSDADCLLHALTDAILGALGAGDLGEHFPDTDDRWQDADSRVFLTEAVRMLSVAGYVIGNVDTNILLETPKLGARKDEIRETIATLLKTDVANVSIKARTHEGLGPIGASEAVAAQAIVLLLEAPAQQESRR